jgi:hypothetical protein
VTFTFAWVDENDAFVARDDEDVFAFELLHAEGEFATLRVEIRNPKTGLLAPARKQWVWFGYDDGGSTGAVALFKGRLIAIPESITDELVSLSFVARPSDYEDQKAALAATLRVAPYWDPVWINPTERNNPDVVLESRPQLWHIDRVTHDLTVSDIIEGEDGILALDSGDAFYDSLQASFSSVPVSRITCQATVQWGQAAKGSIDLSGIVAAAFAAAGSVYGAQSYTGQGLQEDWPERGDRIGAGWTVGRSSAFRIDGSQIATTLLGVELAEARAGFPLWTLDPVLFADYEVSRQRTETISFSVDADVQQIVAEPREEQLLTIALSSSQVGSFIDGDASPGFTQPIGDVRRPSYFLTDRGKQSLESLIVLCRARLLARARCVTLTREVAFDAAVGLSCRHSMTFTDDRIPGGGATGKIVSYSLALNGDSGQAIGSVSIACTIGRGTTISVDEGDPVYADGYSAQGWQAITGGATVIASADLSYSDFDTQPIDDDGVNLLTLDAASAVISCVVVNGPTAQRAAMAGGFEDIGEAFAALNEDYTEVALTMLPLTGGPFETSFAVTVSDLAVPKTIDLEVSS